MSGFLGDPRALEDVERQFHDKEGVLKDKLSIDNPIAVRWRKQYRVSHNLWQFPGNWLQIANYDRYSNFEAISEMPCLFTFRKVQKITHSTQKTHKTSCEGCLAMLNSCPTQEAVEYLHNSTHGIGPHSSWKHHGWSGGTVQRIFEVVQQHGEDLHKPHQDSAWQSAASETTGTRQRA